MSMELSTDRATGSGASETTLPAAGGGVALKARVAWLGLANFAWAAPSLALALGFVAMVSLVAGVHGLAIRWPGSALLGEAQKILLVAYAPLVAAYAADTLLGPRARAGFLRTLLFSPRFLVDLLLAIVVVEATLLTFVHLEQLVPALNSILWDSPLWRIDAWLHLGIEPAARLSDAAGEHGWLRSFDRAYGLAGPVQLALPLLFLISRRLRPDRGRFFFAFCVLWMLGGLVVVLGPSLGPCYYRPSRFVWLDGAPDARHLQATLLQDYVRFRGDPLSGGSELARGIAGFPSMQVGALAFFALATWRRFRALSAGLWALTAVVFVSSLALAWHYAIGGYVGVLLAALAWWIAGRVVPPDEDPAAGAQAAAATPASPARGGAAR